MYLTVAVLALSLLALGAVSGAPLFETSQIVKKPVGDYGYRGIMGDFVRLKDGSLLMSYTDGDIKCIRSTDEGKTWGEPYVLVPQPAPPAKGHIGAPGFLHCANGDLLVTYYHSTHPATPYYATNYYRRSADEGKTWSDQYCYTPHPGYLLVHNDRLLRLSTGRLLAVAEYKAYLPSTEDHSGYVGMSFQSNDDGYSWYPSANTVDLFKDKRMEVQEADVVELRDGRLLMFARTYSGYPVFAYSTDKGESWGPPVERTDIPMPYAGLPTVRRIPSTGDLLFIWISKKSNDKQNPKIQRRCGLAAAISKDEGQTLTNLRDIAYDENDDFGYQCVEFLEDGVVLIAYHARDGIRLARIGTDWFYGK